MADIYYAILKSDMKMRRYNAEDTEHLRPYAGRTEYIEPIIFKKRKDAVKYLIDEYDAKALGGSEPSDNEKFLVLKYTDEFKIEHDVRFIIEIVAVKGETNVGT